MKNRNLLILLVVIVLVIFITLLLYDRSPTVNGSENNGNRLWGKVESIFGAKLMMTDGPITIEGSDNNGNGVWDDVESKIVAKYEYDKNLEKAMFQLARAIQRSVIEANPSKEISLKYSTQILRAFECIRSVDIQHKSDVIDVESWVVNDEVKTKRYIKYNSLLSGEQVNLGNDDAYCEFEVEK